jgi:hypothetical protein
MPILSTVPATHLLFSPAFSFQRSARLNSALWDRHKFIFIGHLDEHGLAPKPRDQNIGKTARRNDRALSALSVTSSSTRLCEQKKTSRNGSVALLLAHPARPTVRTAQSFNVEANKLELSFVARHGGVLPSV